MARVKGVPILVHEQQVQTEHPVTQEFINHSTHILCTLLGPSPQPSYYLCVLSRLVSRPRGYPIFDFNSLPELLVRLIDCLSSVSDPLLPDLENLHLVAHRDALKRVHILHHDISLFNLLLVLAMHSNLGEDFLDHVLQGPEKTRVQAKIQKLSCRGHLGDWGYAVPTDDACSKDFTQGATTGATGVCISGKTQPVSWVNLKDTHNIIIPMADEPLPSGASSLIDTSPLQHTVCFPLYIYPLQSF